MLGSPRQPGSTCVALCLSLLGCADHVRAPEFDAGAPTDADTAGTITASGDTRVSDAADLPVSAPGPADAAVVTVITPRCEEVGLEFPVPCRDAALPAHDAGLDAAAGAARDAGDSGATEAATPCGTEGCPRDAAADVTPPAPDAAQFGPCAELARDCGHVYFEVQLPASCSISRAFGMDNLSVRFRACESCGLPGTIDQYDLTIKGCGGCEQVYSEGTAAQIRLGANACRELNWGNLRFDMTSAERFNCVDVYARVGSSTDGMSNDALHSVRVCRCDRQAGTCTACSGSACGP